MRGGSGGLGFDRVLLDELAMGRGGCDSRWRHDGYWRGRWWWVQVNPVAITLGRGWLYMDELLHKGEVSSARPGLSSLSPVTCGARTLMLLLYTEPVRLHTCTFYVIAAPRANLLVALAVLARQIEDSMDTITRQSRSDPQALSKKSPYQYPAPRTRG
jgi:hypothetical protein